MFYVGRTKGDGGDNEPEGVYKDEEVEIESQMAPKTIKNNSKTELVLVRDRLAPSDGVDGINGIPVSSAGLSVDVQEKTRMH